MYRCKIFIATNDSSLLKKLKTILTKEGYLVTGEAEEGHIALRMIRSMAPDLVILDVELPGMNGLEIAKIIEEDKLAPVILLTPNWQKDYVEKAKEHWVFAFLVKPVEESSLLPLVEVTLVNFQKMLKLEQEVNRLKETLETRKLVERAKGILMETLGLTEGQAFRRIQKQSMDKCVSMRAIAEAIILAHDISKNGKK
ncbi:ANTAR domain-containing response regulator [Calderihabitans maritimus]|uniref:Stage 0 sporulation protein A homolog n=1 Tax=Calderihabitans maritimus TaxID=1246530 RepID=A0A1Z5HR43_9FIRM|nr:ANTAR domain-containing protein [Calderihabitans maritimus]GAW92003.1 response regulator receiver/ANTAR domain-containing protein [Calderihabitans maritimus]